MPSQPKPSLWPLIKEMFFNQKELTDYIRRHKLISFLIAVVVVLFVLVLFSTEQSIQQNDRNTVLRAQVAGLLKDGSSDCTTQALSAAEDYRRVNRLLDQCQNARAAPPAPKPKPRREPVTALVPRHVTDDESALKRKLDAIR